MKFYGREKEVLHLQAIREQSITDHSRFTVVTGRRRIGKTSLILKALEKENPVYLFVGKKSESLLCREFCTEISEKLAVYIPEPIHTFGSLFKYLLEIAKNRSFDLVIDEFQELYHVNPAIFSDIQKLWDTYKETTNVNLIVSGSIYTLMHEIFQNQKEPLFGRADSIMHIAPFSTGTLKQIISDCVPEYMKKDLLALYTITGGVPKYVEVIIDNKAYTENAMIGCITRENSLFIDEGRNLLIGEFGKNYATYFSILSAISDGINTQSEIEAIIGDKSIGGHLKRLLEDYRVIERFRPIFAKEGTQAIKYEISDPFLKFWFRFIEKNRPMVEIGNFSLLRETILSQFTDYSGISLERFFRQKLAESGKYAQIGSWWESKKNQYQIDIVAICGEKHKAEIIEVKRNRRYFKKHEFEIKVEHLRNKILFDYDINSYCLSIDDM